MLEIALEVLKKLEEKGYECYLVGGFVRDYYLGIESKDVDICTNAKSKEILKVFPNSKIPKEIYGAVTLFYKDVRFEITTFRREIRYENRKPVELEYISSFVEDIKRRDFTINSLCMNSSGEIIDILNGRKDIDNKIIKCINKVDISLKEDPLRILRAIRFATQLNFTLDKELIKGIKKNRKQLENISYNRKMIELNKIFASKNVKIGVNLIKQLSISKQLKLYDLNKLVFVNDILGYWVQLDKDNLYEYTKQEKNNIKKVRELLKIKSITHKEMYKYGLYICTLAAQILNIDKDKIYELKKTLPINSQKDIKITPKETLEITNKSAGSWLKKLYDEITLNILDNKLLNDKETLKTYIKNKYK